MKKLIMSCARARMVRGETQYNKMSRFVKEIPANLIDRGAGTGKSSVGAGSFGGFVGNSFGGSSFGGTSSGKGMSAADLFKSNVFDKTTKPKTTSTSSVLVKGNQITKAGNLDYGPGDRVKHIKFGVGTVASVEDSGRDYEVLVNFDTVGPKKMFASFAKLKKI